MKRICSIISTMSSDYEVMEEEEVDDDDDDKVLIHYLLDDDSENDYNFVMLKCDYRKFENFGDVSEYVINQLQEEEDYKNHADCIDSDDFIFFVNNIQKDAQEKVTGNHKNIYTFSSKSMINPDSPMCKQIMVPPNENMTLHFSLPINDDTMKTKLGDLIFMDSTAVLNINADGDQIPMGINKDDV